MLMYFLFSLFLQLFAYLGFVVSVLWIYSIANEIVNLLQVSFNVYEEFILLSISKLGTITKMHSLPDALY